MNEVLSQEQMADYERDGHLIVREVLSADETRELRTVVEEKAPEAYAPSLQYPAPGKYTIRGNQLAEHPALAAVAENPAIVGPVEALLGQRAHLSAFVAT